MAQLLFASIASGIGAVALMGNSIESMLLWYWIGGTVGLLIAAASQYTAD